MAAQQPQEQGRRFLFWHLPNKQAKHKQTVQPSQVGTLVQVKKPQTTYERMIEGAHKFDKVFNIPLGYVLAVANVLGFMDVLSNGKVLGNVPNLFYLWLAVMGLGVDLQFFLIIGRLPDLARMLTGKSTKGIFWGFNLAFLALLGYTSVIIGAVFVQHVDAGGSMSADMAILGINTQWFVFERAALATGLLVLMATDRAMERWRMQLVPMNVTPTLPDATKEPQPQQSEEQTSDLVKILQAMQEMNQQNLQAMQQMNQHSLNVTIEQFTKVTIEAVRETVGQVVDALPAYAPPPQIAAPGATSANTGQYAGEKPNQPEQPLMDAPDKPKVPEQGKHGYGDAIEALYEANPGITPDEIVIELGCSKSTATTWLRRVKPMH